MKNFSLSPKNSAYSRVAETMGYSTELLHATGRAKLSIAAVYHHLIHPLRLGQVCFAFCERTGAPRAYITYALCTARVAGQLANGREISSLRLDEWNEGTICWITDVVAPYPDSLRALLFLIRNNPIFLRGIKSVRVKGNYTKYIDIRKKL
ncbi:MAG TPA: toxin-activating lysine-acyltransferase [Pseudoalteromonas prydzensis]|uniref:RTX toxin-activating lysine-acyltransferase n=2 Tax=root TaxID=1 RepID=A0A7V1GGZ3_9GAMM|nr:toxin-activating lysine-acyltransferase [Pseudoalteromonas prydzensis]HEA19209.1 toxin-activating lysine-acyltransferase [Pseudoalteromonas prydzensis]